MVEAVTEKYNTNTMERWLLFLSLVALALAFVLFLLRRRFREKKAGIDSEIAGFKS
jgi:LPXTG-motif cell wall-anchored protein